MAGNRKAAEDLILDVISKISGYKENTQMYKDKFAKMSDKDFEQFINDLDSEKVRLSIVEPNFTDRPMIPNEEIMKVGESLGYNFFPRLWVEGKDGGPSYLTPVGYLTLMTTVRRASQSLTKKVSVPPHTRVRDLLTGQVTGESKGATVSGPENQMLAGMGANNTAIEMMNNRGGDRRSEQALMAILSKTGRASQSVVSQFSSGVQSGTTLRTFLTAAMHRVNL